MVKTLLVGIVPDTLGKDRQREREGQKLTDSSFVCRFVALIESELNKNLLLPVL